MYFLHPIALASAQPSVALLALVAGPSAVLVCPPLQWPGHQHGENWSAIYRLAYEQLMVAFAPSKFQRALEPSLN
jgi:hypothetical protein